MYGLGQTEVAIRNAERAINNLIDLCRYNNGQVYLTSDDGTRLCLTDNVHFSYFLAINIKE